MAHYHHLAACLINAILALYLLLPAPAIADASSRTLERSILTIHLNTEKKGEFIVFVTPDADLLVKEKDLLTLGVKNFTGNRQKIEGEDFVSLKSIKGLRFEYKEEDLSLHLQAAPEILGVSNVLDFAFTPARYVYQPKGVSAFINYSISANDTLQSKSWLEASTETGFRIKDFLLLSNFLYHDQPVENRLVRLSSSLTWERKEKLWSLTLGDFYASSGITGSTVNMGGVSFGKNYDLNPYYVKAPSFDYRGFVTLPTEMEIYINGTPVRREKLTPGQYDLKNLPLISGLNNMKVVLKDAYGRETVIEEPFYYTETLLKKGEHEFNYYAGALRQSYGLESNAYGPGVFLFSHRYGLTDRLTLGARGEVSQDLLNAGISSSFEPAKAGVTEGVLSLSSRRGESGASLYAAHFFSSPVVNFGLSGRVSNKDYTTLTNCTPAQYEAYLSFGLKGIIPDALNFNFSRIWPFTGDKSDRATLTYTKSLLKNLYLTFSLSQVWENKNDTQFFLNLIYYPWQEHNLSTSISRDRDSTYGSMTWQKNPTVKKEDYTYRLTATTTHLTSENENKTLNSVNPYLQINRGYGQYTFEYNGSFVGSHREQESYRLAFSGALLYADGHAGLSIPVYDSFGIVKVGNIKDVKVKLNHQEAGKTNGKGETVIPYLRSNIDNYLSIDDKNIPINYTIKSVGRWVNPPTRGGAFIPFEVVKTQAFSGKLRIREKGVSIPLENVIIKLKVRDRTEEIPVTKEGEFYFENIPPGKYEAEFSYRGHPARFVLKIPESEKFLVDMGVIELEME